MAKIKANSKCMVEFSIEKGKKMLIAFTYLLLLTAMTSISGTRSFTSHIRN
jgi:hypothetical protein